MNENLIAEIDRAVAALTEADLAQEAVIGVRDRQEDLQDANSADHIQMALAYLNVEGTDEDHRRLGPWAPMFEYNDRSQFPPPLSEVTDNILSSWRSVTDRSSSPLLRARLGDLCWSARVQPKPHLAAQTAIDAYVDLAAMEREPLYTVQALVRARELALELNDLMRQRAVETLLLDAAAAGLTADIPVPGVILRALAPLVRPVPLEFAARRNDLLERAIDSFEGNPHAFESAVQLWLVVAADGDRPSLRSRIVEQWLMAADRATEPLIALSHRQHSLERALLYAMPQKAEQIRILIQSMDHDALGLTQQRLRIPAEMFEAFSQHIRGSYVATLESTLTQGPLSGDPEANVVEIATQSRENPLQSLFARSMLGPYNSTIWRAGDGSERDRLNLAEHQSFKITLIGRLIAEVLQVAAERFGPPTETEFESVFSSDLIKTRFAKPLAHGAYLIATGRPDDGAHVMLPRIESVIRELAFQCGCPITIDPKGNVPGGVKTLGATLAMLEGIIEEDWRRHFVNLLVDPLGVNLRNRVLHGLAGPSWIS